ncbi:MAG: hypothetical protein QM724_08810 [Flavobacteriales bacterium]
MFFLRLDRKTKEIVHESFKEFSDEMITSFMTEKEEKKAEKNDEDLELYSYDLGNIIRRDDGGAVMVAEQYYSYTQCYSNGPTPTA